MNKKFFSFCSAFIAAAAFLMLSCSSVQNQGDEYASDGFLTADPESPELFHVLLTADSYQVVQMKKKASIARVEDKGGDAYISSELTAFNKIDEVRDGIIAVWLFPDTGRLMKIRPQKSTYLMEIDKLITDDIQRWNFTFPNKTIEPTSFSIRYRVVLKKTLSDEEIIKEVQDRMREGN